MKRALIFALIYLCMTIPSMQAHAQKLPGESAKLLPGLVTEVDTYWEDIPDYVFPAGLIDQESNWKPTATLQTSRELGCGLGQFTLAKNADGSARFDAIKEMRQSNSALANWDWRDCQQVTMQMRAVVLKTKGLYRTCEATMVDGKNALMCVGAGYNGGAGSVAKRQRFCRATPGCNPKVWEGNLDTQCPQSNVKVQGYGESFCDINSKYPGRIYARMPKFRPVMDKLWLEKHPAAEVVKAKKEGTYVP